MLRSLRKTLGYRIQAGDGELGKVADFYFDDSTWRVRYLVVKTGTWLSERQVLVLSVSMREPDWQKDTLPVNLTMRQVQSCPSIDADLPVSRQKEMAIARYYQAIPYWQTASPGMMMVPVAMAVPPEIRESPAGDPHLRSVKEVSGYRIHATDGDIGHVADFLVQTDDWAIRYLVVDFSRWLPNRKVLISPAWITSVAWNAKRVQVVMTAEQVRGSQPFDPGAPVNRDYEARLYDYYGRPKYWEPEKAPGKEPPAPGGVAAGSKDKDPGRT